MPLGRGQKDTNVFPQPHLVQCGRECAHHAIADSKVAAPRRLDMRSGDVVTCCLLEIKAEGSRADEWTDMSQGRGAKKSVVVCFG